jgi:L-aminopeptidase/D-esterase-like protein
VPIVPAAILFDLSIGDSSVRPDAAAGYAACAAATRDAPAEGNVGAGAGAMIGKLFGIGQAMRGGLGTASISVGGITVAALVAVNAMGDVVDPANGRIVAGARAPPTARASSTRWRRFAAASGRPPTRAGRRRQPARRRWRSSHRRRRRQGRGDQDRRRWRTTAWRGRSARSTR